MAGNRWIGVAAVSLLALLAQPAAVTATPQVTVGSEDTREEDVCAAPIDVDGIDRTAGSLLGDVDTCEQAAILDEAPGELATVGLDADLAR